ncbi:hypothetical protein [Streptomyces sp. NPDC048638]|uniref:hypothetical protein n=1 Tax=Streptomyces sp. NPDC048638 TaxID=3365580 RepID=UPI00371C8A2E
MTALPATHPGEAAATTPAPLAVIVTRADGRVARIGPITGPGVAGAIHASLTRATTIPEKADASAEIARFDAAEPHLPLLDAEVDTVLELMDDTEQGVEAPFPNLWDRLVAQHGLTVADALMRVALAARRKDNRPPARHPSRSRADERFEHALREVLMEHIGPGGTSPAALDDTVTSIRRLAEAWARSRPLHTPGS